jgi:hypothetical protein
MRFRATRLIDSLCPPDEAGKKFANDLLDEKLKWKNLTIQLTGVPAWVLISAFWLRFAREMKEQAPILYPDVLNIKWICDHDFQEDEIQTFLFSEI